MSKQEATYSAGGFKHVEVGYSATLSGVEHPLLGRESMVHTSRVQSYDEATGIIETRNTIYRPRAAA